MPIWHGDKAEATELGAAAINNCECEQTTGKVCATHKAMKEDQKYLDRLVFYRQQRAKLRAEEFAEDLPC